MRRSCVLVAAALALVVLVSTVGADKPIHFAYTIQVGQTQDFKVKFNQETDMGFFMMSLFVDMEVSEECIGEDENGYLMEMTFNKVEASRMFQDKMSQDPLAANLTGGKVSYHIDRHGTMTKLKASGFIEGWSGARQIVKPIVESGYSYLPDKEIAPGGSWGKDRETETNEQGMEITTISKFTFKEMKKEMDRECAKIEGKVENVISGETATAQGNMTADGKGKGKFEIYFDPVTSTLVKVKASMDIEMDLVPEKGGDTIETTISYAMERKLM